MAGGRNGRRLDTLQTVELAEGMEVHLRMAGPFLRLMAFLLDILIKIAGFFLIAMLVGFGSMVLGGNIATGIYELFAFVLLWFYPVLFEVSRWGATPGKKIVGIRVVNEAGGAITIGQAMIRNFIRSIEIMLPLLPMVAFFNPRFQRLGDLAAGTLVVYSRQRHDPISGVPPTMKSSIPVNIALTREERASMIAFRYRSANWSEARRAELANHLSPMTGQSGPKAVNSIVGMAQWLEEDA